MRSLTEFDAYMLIIGVTIKDNKGDLTEAHKLLAAGIVKYKTKFGIYDIDPNNGRKIDETLIWVQDPFNKQWLPYAPVDK